MHEPTCASVNMPIPRADSNVPRRVLSQSFPESQALKDASVPSLLTPDSYGHLASAPSSWPSHLSGNPGPSLGRPLLRIPGAGTELRALSPLGSLTSLLGALVGGECWAWPVEKQSPFS